MDATVTPWRPMKNAEQQKGEELERDEKDAGCALLPSCEVEMPQGRSQCKSVMWVSMGECVHECLRRGLAVAPQCAFTKEEECGAGPLPLL